MTRIGVAVLGASARSALIFRYLQQNPQTGFVTGTYDLIPQRGRHLIDQYGVDGAVVYESLDEALADPRVGAAFIGTHDAAHVEPACAALRAGKHVYCEKPMAVTLESCDAIVEAARTSPAVFYLGMNLRHGPVHETLHEIALSGRLGTLLTIEANEYYYGGRTYFRRWNRLREYGGGLWITKACHDFDLLNWFAGGRPTRVFAVSSLSHYRPKPEAGTHCRTCPIKDTCPDFYDVEGSASTATDAMTTLLEEATGVPRDLCLYNSDKDTFDNGIAVVEYDNDVRATYTVNVVSARDTRQMRLMGTDGAAEGDMSEGTVTVWKRHTGQKESIDLTEQMRSSHGGSDDRILDDFFRCCRTGDKPRSSWADGRLSVQVGLAARASCDTGRAIALTH